MSTIPLRKESFKQMVRRILYEQTRPVDQLHVCLYGYQAIEPDLPRDPRLAYHLEPDHPGPWVRYQVANTLHEDDILVTLDDDLIYPKDYLEKGTQQLVYWGKGTAICYSGICWDPLVEKFSYGANRWLYLAEGALTVQRQVSLHMGQTGFFWAVSVRGALDFSLAGFCTNDDMMIGYQLQRRGVRIRCCPKPAGWIREMDSSRTPHALFVRDSHTRHETFRQMVERLGFDPTAGRLPEILKKPKRILVLADVCPPLFGAKEFDHHLRAMYDDDTSVHLLAPVPVSQTEVVQKYVDRPYDIHAVSVPEPGGRLDWFSPVRGWRNWRVSRRQRMHWSVRLRKAYLSLKPTRVLQHTEKGLIDVGPLR